MRPTVLHASAAPTKLDRLRAATEQCLAFGALGRRLAADALVPELTRRLETLFARIAECEAGGYTRAEIGTIVWPVRDLLAASSLCRRLQFSPRGHAGDYETLERLGADLNPEPAGTLGRVVEEVVLQGPLATRHQARMARQAALLIDTLSDRATRVLVLGAGPAGDVRTALELVQPRRGQLVLHDEDPTALDYVAAQLGPVASRVVRESGDPLRAVERLAAHGPYDLVIAGALLDELHDGRAVALLHAIHAELLAPGGHLVFSCTAAGDPYRAFRDYFTDWVVQGRTEREVIRLCQLAGTGPGEVTLRRDADGAVLHADVQRALPLQRVA